MFLFKKKVREVVLVTSSASAFEYNKPDFVVKPDWLKNIMPSSRNVFDQVDANIKACYGINETFRKSIMLKAPEDIWIRMTDEGQNNDGMLYWNMVGELSKGTVHPDWQRGEFSRDRIHFKISTPWKGKGNFTVFQSEPMYHRKMSDEIRVAQGMIDWSMVPEFNVNLLVKKHSGEGYTDYCIKFDEPLCMFTPLTDDKVKIRHELLSEEEVRKFVDRSFFRPANVNTYNMLKKKKKESKCPFGFK